MNIQQKRIIIHTGPGKTGSSAIQAWLTKNTKWLASKSIYYPEHTLPKEKISSGNLREILTQTENTEWQVDEKKVERLIKRFHKSKCTILLLSSEYFFYKIIQIQSAIPEAEFVAYIRNPVELLESSYNQSVKRHSNTKLFIPPKEINNFLWQYLTRVYNKIDNSKLHLRPFDEALMQGGNIVADLLSALNVELTEVIENKRINPSFTFQSLEFKRLLNHFGLGSLEQGLDKILQRCEIGEREYSLIPPDKFKRLNNEGCKAMAEFIDKFTLSGLKPLLNAFKLTQQRPYTPQTITLLQLTEILDYIKESDAGLHYKLQKLVHLHSNLIVDNVLIFELFSVENTLLNKSELIDSLLLKHINQFNVAPIKRGKICYELASFYLLQNDLSNALIYAKAAHYFNPKNKMFIEKLNEILRLINIYKHGGAADIQDGKMKMNKLSKLKHLLKR